MVLLIVRLIIISIIIMCCVLYNMYHIPAEIGMSILIEFK